MSATGIITNVDDALALYKETVQTRIMEATKSSRKPDITGWLEAQRPNLQALIDGSQHGISADVLKSDLVKSLNNPEELTKIGNFSRTYASAGQRIIANQNLQDISSHGLKQVIRPVSGIADSQLVSGAEEIEKALRAHLGNNGSWLLDRVKQDANLEEYFPAGKAVSGASIKTAAEAIEKDASKLIELVGSQPKAKGVSPEKFKALVEKHLNDQAMPKFAVTQRVEAASTPAPVAEATATAAEPAAVAEPATAAPAQVTPAAASTASTTEVKTGLAKATEDFEAVLAAKMKGDVSKEHIEHLREGFKQTFKDQTNVVIDKTRMEELVGKFTETVDAKELKDEAKEAIRKGTPHKELFEKLNEHATGHDAEAVKGQLGKAVESISEKMNLSWYKDPNHVIGGLAHFDKNWGSPVSIVKKEWSKADGKEGQRGLVFARVGGTLTGVGLIISGFNDLKGREANDNSGQVESHPLSGLLKTVAGAGLTGVSMCYKRGIRAANANAATVAS